MQQSEQSAKAQEDSKNAGADDSKQRAHRTSLVALAKCVDYLHTLTSEVKEFNTVESNLELAAVLKFAVARAERMATFCASAAKSMPDSVLKQWDAQVAAAQSKMLKEMHDNMTRKTTQMQTGNLRLT